MSNFGLWEGLGTLPLLENLTLVADNASHPVHAPKNLNSQSEGPMYFALENQCVKGSLLFIQHFLDFIGSPFLKSIKVYPIILRNCNENDEDPFAPFMTTVASKWSESLRDLVISMHRTSDRTPILKCLILLTDFHEMQTFQLIGWKMENADDDVRHLVMSWPKLRSLDLDRTFISLSTLRIIVLNCVI